MVHEIVIYKDVPVINETKQGKKYLGDIPVFCFNNITKRFECVVNLRGKAYAARNRMKYRSRTHIQIG